MSKTYTTSKGSVLPLMQLKSKDYMLIAHRLVWLVDDEPSYTTNVEFPILTEDEAMAKVTLTIFNNEGKVIKQVQDVKRESKKDFPDFSEKAVTGALGRCLAQCGKGTAYAVQDLDEGHRIADAPIESPKETKTETVSSTSTDEPPKKASSFRKPKKPEDVPAPEVSSDWS